MCQVASNWQPASTPRNHTVIDPPLATPSVLPDPSLSSLADAVAKFSTAMYRCLDALRRASDQANFADGQRPDLMYVDRQLAYAAAQVDQARIACEIASRFYTLEEIAPDPFIPTADHRGRPAFPSEGGSKGGGA